MVTRGHHGPRSLKFKRSSLSRNPTQIFHPTSTATNTTGGIRAQAWPAQESNTTTASGDVKNIELFLAPRL